MDLELCSRRHTTYVKDIEEDLYYLNLLHPLQRRTWRTRWFLILPIRASCWGRDLQDLLKQKDLKQNKLESRSSWTFPRRRQPTTSTKLEVDEYLDYWWIQEPHLGSLARTPWRRSWSQDLCQGPELMRLNGGLPQQRSQGSLANLMIPWQEFPCR